MPHSDDALNVLGHFSLRLLVGEPFMGVRLRSAQAGCVDRYTLLSQAACTAEQRTGRKGSQQTGCEVTPLMQWPGQHSFAICAS